ncbi:hypothetical protein ACEPAI_2329 [Sanghuangporus weigelae]
MSYVGHPHNASSSKGKRSTPPPDVRGVSYPDYMEDSPANLRNSHTKRYQEGDLDSMREAVREEVGPFIPEISLDAFMKYLLPPLKDWIDLPEVVALLEEEGDVITSSGKKVFKTFEKAPRDRKEHEDTVFAPLVDIYGKICRHATRDDRGVRQRPDAGLIPKRLEELARVAMAKKGETRDEKNTRERRKRVLTAEGKTISWYDIAMAYEMKLEEIIDQRNDNAEKGIFHLQQTATLDACRRFTFGATIENRMMRLWFSSRGTLVVSKPFDFTTRISDLAQVFLSLAFASEEELGWDPTVQAIMRCRSMSKVFAWLRLSDLEYARRKAVAHRMRTASMHLMAAETIQRAYLYKPTPPNRASIGPKLQGTFFHNDLHDMESLLWIALYQVFRQSDAYESDTVDQEESERRGEEQDIAASLLFPDSNVIDITQRLLCLKEPETFLGRVSWMPEKLEGIKISLDMLRDELIESYIEFEEKFPMLQMHALQMARDAAEKNFGACVNLALQIESATALPFTSPEDDLDEQETSAHPFPQAQAEALFRFNRKSSRPSEENEEHAPESPTPCRIGKRKRADKEPSPERRLRKCRKSRVWFAGSMLTVVIGQSLSTRISAQRTTATARAELNLGWTFN